jgi:hypothetical protein
MEQLQMQMKYVVVVEEAEALVDLQSVISVAMVAPVVMVLME